MAGLTCTLAPSCSGGHGHDEISSWHPGRRHPRPPASFGPAHRRLADRGPRPGLRLGEHGQRGGSRPSPPPTIAQQAATVRAQDAYTPVDGNKEMNVNVLEDQVEHYYGSASATYPALARSRPVQHQQLRQADEADRDRRRGLPGPVRGRYHGPGKPAVVFDIDDTLLNTYDYTLAEQFGYTSASNLIWVNDAAFPAVFYMPQLVSFAAEPRVLGLLHHRPSAVPDRRHDQGPDQRRVRGAGRRAPVPQAVRRRRPTCTARPPRPVPRSSTSQAPASTSPAWATRSWPTSATSTATCSAATPDTRSSSPTRCTTFPDRTSPTRRRL